jgi:hypothetical protein
MGFERRDRLDHNHPANRMDMRICRCIVWAAASISLPKPPKSRPDATTHLQR